MPYKTNLDMWARNKRLTINVLQGMTLNEAGKSVGLSRDRVRQITRRTLEIANSKVRRVSRSDISFMYESKKDHWLWENYTLFDLGKARRFRDHLVPIVWNLKMPKYYE